MNLQSALPLLIPRAIAWAEAQSATIARSGQPLAPDELAVARRVGVARPARVRVLEVPRMPLPDDPLLRRAAEAAGLLGANSIGLTLEYGIFVRRGHWDGRLIAHECRHVYQYEQAGSIAAFLPVYLEQIVTLGYENAPLERDARAHEP